MTVKNKKLIFMILLVLTTCSMLAGFTYYPTTVKNATHNIANTAREMGLPEDDPIIIRAKQLWSEANEKWCYDRDIIASVVYNEAWYGTTDRHKELVAGVVCNSVIASDKM